MKDIGLVLKNARENKEYTQKQVMELTGINKKSLSGYENHVAEPDLDTFAKLAKLYGFSADEVLEIKPHADTFSLSKNELKLLSLFRTFDSTHQQEFLVQLEALRKYLQKKTE